MASPRAGPLVAALVLVLAGCVGPEADPTPAREPDVAPAPAGRLQVQVVQGADPNGTSPAADATVRAANRTVATGPDGGVTLEGLPAGSTILEAQAPGHHPANGTVDVPANGTAHATVRLVPEVVQRVHRGHLECGLTVLIVAGDCLLLADHAASQAGAPARPGDLTDERTRFDLVLHPGWTHATASLVWNATEPGADRMRLDVRRVDVDDPHGPRVARVQGPAPVQLELAPGTPAPGATADEPVGPDGAALRVHAYLPGAADDPAGTGLLGVAAVHDLELTLVLRTTYGPPRTAGTSFAATASDA